MTTGEHRAAMTLLAQAKRGDEAAHRLLVDMVSREYSGMVFNLYTVDPMLGRDDILQEFYWGIWRAVEKVDHRGDPIFHLAQRGQWAVKSVVAAVNRRRHGTAAKEGGVSVVSLDADESDMKEPREDSFEDQTCEVIEIVERQQSARRRMHLIRSSDKLRPTHAKALAAVLEHNIDLSQLGGKRQLAKALGVSGQRVSVIVKQIQQIAEAEGAAA